MAEVKQAADTDLRSHEEFLFSEPGPMMDLEEDRVRPKRSIISTFFYC